MDVTTLIPVFLGTLTGSIICSLGTAYFLLRHFRRRIAEEARNSDLERFHVQKTAEALLDRERHFREFLDFLPQAVLETDLAGRFSFLNQVAYSTLGFTPDDVNRGLTLSRICHSSHLDRLFLHLKHIQSGEGPIGDEYLLVRKDGSAFPALLYVSRVFLNGSAAGFRGVAVDISARRRAESEVGKLAAVVQNCNELVALASLDGQLIFLNHTGKEILGVAENELARHSVWSFVPSGFLPKVQNEVLPSIHETGSWEGELRYRHVKSGSETDVHALCFLIRDPATGEPQHLAHVSLDITGRKKEEIFRERREQSIQRLNTALVALARNKDLYGGDLSLSFGLITEAAAAAMDVGRASIWLFFPGQLSLECTDLFDRASQRHEKGYTLESSLFPAYFAALRGEMLIAADDALADPRTSEFADAYLKPMGIVSMLDAPIQVGGRVVGVVCHEQVGNPRVWSVEEQSFVTAIAGVTSMVLEANERRVMDSALRLARDELEKRVIERTAELGTANERLRQAQAELEQRVVARTEELSRTNASLRRLIQEQEVNIDLAAQMMAMINPPLKRRSPLPSGGELFVCGRYVPCHAAGGDHFFVRVLKGADGTLPRSHVSLKDQSGHEVGCILRSIMTDLVHNALLQDSAGSGLEHVISRLNDEVCASGFFREDCFFTSINLDIHHETLAMEYLSTGHPPFLLIRGREVRRFPENHQAGANLPAGMMAGHAFGAGQLQLQAGDRLLLYSDGLLELPVLKGSPAFSSLDLQNQISGFLTENPDQTVSEIMSRLFETFDLVDHDGKGLPPILDDVAVLGLEVERAGPWMENTLQPRDHDHFRALVDGLFEEIEKEWRAHGFETPEHRLKLALEESLLNAWVHGNKRDPACVIRVRRRYGNDAILQVEDQGKGFEWGRLYDPTSFDNRKKPSGRGIFVLRMIAEDIQWCENGKVMTLSFSRRPWTGPKTAGQVRRSSLAFWPEDV